MRFNEDRVKPSRNFNRNSCRTIKLVKLYYYGFPLLRLVLIFGALICPDELPNL